VSDQCSRVRGYFIFDVLAVIPGLITLERSESNYNYFKLLRFVHWNRLFVQLSLILDKVMFAWLNYHRQKVVELIELIKLALFVLITAHIVACGWIAVGRINLPTDESAGWVNKLLAVEDCKTDSDCEYLTT
jgi:hypothetical protein